MASLLESVDAFRQDVRQQLAADRKLRFGQFLTPPPVARLMASMISTHASEISILDAGAGVGSLFAAAIAELTTRPDRPSRILVEAFEIDPIFLPYLHQTAELCKQHCAGKGIEFSAKLLQVDFLHHHEEQFFLRPVQPSFSCAILNPPYRKIRSDSEARKALRRLGVETSNLYAGFLALAMQLLIPGGELVSITPRSFCNGPYFKPFRKALLRNLALQRLHVYESRDAAFRDDDVLQENIILHAVKSGPISAQVRVTASQGPTDPHYESSTIRYDQIVYPGDRDFFIHLPTSNQEALSDAFQKLPCSVQDLGLCVSTGRVVDFRSKELLRDKIAPNCVPLIYPAHFTSFGLGWPKDGKKPNALIADDRADEFLIPNGNYVLVRRFSAKEERRRIIARVYEAQNFAYARVGFENHLNYFHENGGGLELELARGLALFLNSTKVDGYFRLFSGHTQVNATDLRKLRYPTRADLREIGKQLRDRPSQSVIDQAVDEILLLPRQRAAAI